MKEPSGTPSDLFHGAFYNLVAVVAEFEEDPRGPLEVRMRYNKLAKTLHFFCGGGPRPSCTKSIDSRNILEIVNTRELTKAVYSVRS